MKPIKTASHGELRSTDSDKLGGQFTWREKLKMGGSGTSKILYRSGIPYFDELSKIAEDELAYANFELFRNGLVVRFNRVTKLRVAGCTMEEIERITLVAFRVRISRRASFGPQYIIGLFKPTFRIVHRGEISLYLVGSDQPMIFDVLVGNFKAIKQFFERPPFYSKFHYSVSPNQPELDFSHYLTTFGVMIE